VFDIILFPGHGPDATACPLRLPEHGLARAPPLPYPWGKFHLFTSFTYVSSSGAELLEADGRTYDKLLTAEHKALPDEGHLVAALEWAEPTTAETDLRNS
jgi:hypothetical protein